MRFAVVALLLGSACSPHTAADPQADLAAYNALAAQYNTRSQKAFGRTVFEYSAQQNQLYYLDFTNESPTLHRLDTNGTTLDYGFSVGDGETYNFRASSQIIVTAQPSGANAIYRAYDANARNRLLGQVTLPVPSGTKWEAYAVDGDKIWMVSTDVGTTLMSWNPGSDPVAQMPMGVSGVFEDFGVSGDRMVYLESGRVWVMSVSSGQATWTHNPLQADGTVVQWDDAGLLFSTDKALSYYDFARGQLVDITAAINAKSYRVNDTFDNVSRYSSGGALWKSTVVYISTNGVFGYELGTDNLKPILLTPNLEVRTNYYRPTVLDNGTLYVTGTPSTLSGTNQAAVYKVSLAGL